MAAGSSALSARAERGPRVLQVSAFFAAHGGGIEAVVDQLARRLATAGLRVHWMAGGPAHERPDGVPDGLAVDHAPTWDPLEHRIGLPLPLWSLPALRRLWQAVGANDVVHVHDYIYLPTLLALVFARLRGKPVLLTQHIGEIAFQSGAATQTLRLLNRSVGAWALARAAQVVFVGRPVMQYFAPLVRFAKPPRLLPNGVDHQRFQPALANATAAGGPVPLLFVGRFVEKKGLPILRYAATLPGAAWRFVGWGPLGPDNWAVDERAAVELIGRLPAPQVAEQYRQAALLVLPSTGEGFPLVLQEALACGTPVLVSTEVFEAFPQVDERCVFHVELRGLSTAAAGQALRRRLQALVEAPQRLAEARAPAAALARQWSWAACTEAYADLYRETLANAGSTGPARGLQ